MLHDLLEFWSDREKMPIRDRQQCGSLEATDAQEVGYNLAFCAHSSLTASQLAQPHHQHDCRTVDHMRPVSATTRNLEHIITARLFCSSVREIFPI